MAASLRGVVGVQGALPQIPLQAVARALLVTLPFNHPRAVTITCRRGTPITSGTFARQHSCQSGVWRKNGVPDFTTTIARNISSSCYAVANAGCWAYATCASDEAVVTCMASSPDASGLGVITGKTCAGRIACPSCSSNFTVTTMATCLK